ncbi:MAG TPA: Ig-like domain-containing protein, partial [Baekduia sp.]
MRLRAFLVVAGIATLAVAPSARAATFTVNTTTDDPAAICDTTCSIRGALTEALRNGQTTPDTIAIPAGNYTINAQANGQLPVTSDVTITGASAATTTIRSDGKNARVFGISGSGRQVTISHLRITFGSVVSLPTLADRIGGNILVDAGATLTLDHARVDGGQATRGGGIAIRGSTAKITKSLIDTNTSVFQAGNFQTADAAGILNVAGPGAAAPGPPSTLTLTDSTVAFNTTTSAAGIESTGSTGNSVTITRSTIAYNGGGANGGNGLNRAAGAFTVSGSIVADNTGDSPQDNCSDGITNGGGNAETSASCGFALSNVTNAKGELVGRTFTTAGVETPVLALPATSPAIGLAGTCSGADQRDLGRPQGVGCDAGAYEVDLAPETKLDSNPPNPTASNSPSFSFSSTEPGVTFQCSLTTGTASYSACASPKSYPNTPDGNYTFSVRAVDGTGHTDATPATYTFRLDATPPAAPVIGGANGAQNTTAVTLSGTAEAGASVEVFEGAFSRGTVTATTGGTWTVSFTAAEGQHSYVALARDAAGNVSNTSNTRVITVDTAPPAAPVIGGANATQNFSTVTLSGTAEAGSTVTVLEGATVRGTGTATGGNWTIAFTATDGPHNYTATSRDAAGNTSGASNTRTITVDTAAPNAPLIGGSNATQNTSTVTLSGTAEAGSTVTVLEGATVRGTGTATGGNWTVTFTATDGAHSYTATARDAAGNTSSASNTRTITVDTAAPNAPVIGGSNATQNTTTVTLSGTAEAGAAVEVFEGATLRGNAVATGGNWTITFTATEGAHNYIATARDAAGNTSAASNTRTITVDTGAPTAPVIGGTNTTQNTTAITLSGTAEAGTTVTVLEGATARGTATAAGGNWTISFTAAEGAHSYVATARDAAGNTSGNSNTRTITVDLTAPNPPVIGGSDGSQSSTSVTLSGSAETGATVTVLEGATVRGTGTATGGSWTVTFTAAEGAHGYTANARDAAGNTSGSSNTRKITVDTAAPAAPVIGGAGATQNISTVTLSGTAEAGATVIVLEGATTRGTTTATGGNWTVSFTAADGSHSYVATARDAAGNTSGNSNTRTITVDTTAPAAPVIGGANTTQNTITVTLSGTADAGTTVEVFEGATSRGSAVATGGNWTVTINGASEASHAYVARATDAAGNTSGNSNTRTIIVDLTAPNAPAITAPTENALQNSASVTLSGTAEANATVEVFEGATSRGTTVATAGGTWSRAIAGVTDGIHTYTARATDAANNTSVASAARTIRVDTTAPGAPAITAPADNVLQNSATVTLSGTSEANATVEVFEGATSKGTTVATAGGTWSRAITSVTDGTHTYTARATDAANNTSVASAARTVRVDTTAPPAPAITTPASDVTVGTSTVNLAGTAEANATVEVFDGAASKGTTTATGGNWTLTIAAIADGVHTYTAKATDAAQNTSPASAPRVITVDAAVPDTEITGGPSGPTNNASSQFSFRSTKPSSTFQCKLDGAGAATGSYSACTSPKTYGPLADGAYTLSVIATDALGHPDPSAATQNFTVDTQAPGTTLDGGPSGSIKTDPTFTFHSGEAGARFECRMTRQGGAANSFTACSSPKTYGDLSEVEGTYTFEVRSTDDAGNVGPTAARAFIVDTSPPPVDVTSGPDGPTSDPVPSFAFTAVSATTTDCKLDGPGGAVGTFSACTSPTSFGTLAPGDYVFSLRAIDAAGNETLKTRAFSVALVQQATPTPTPTPSGPGVKTAQEPQPEPNKTVVIQPVSGKTLVKLPGSSTFEPVDVTRGIPVGSTVDTRKSKIRLYAIPKAGKPAESALFYDGIFKVVQSGGVTELQLVEQL